MAGPYSPTGPFTNGSSPGLSAALFNELERWLAQVDNAAATTLSGTTGTATAYMPFQGPHYKKVLLWLNGFQNTSGSTTALTDRKSTRLNSSHTVISYAVFCLKKKTREIQSSQVTR